MDQLDQEIERLGERLERMLAVVQKLADANETLRTQLAASRGTNELLQQRINEARARVEAALSRLPLSADTTADTTE